MTLTLLFNGTWKRLHTVHKSLLWLLDGGLLLFIFLSSVFNNNFFSAGAFFSKYHVAHFTRTTISCLKAHAFWDMHFFKKKNHRTWSRYLECGISWDRFWGAGVGRAAWAWGCLHRGQLLPRHWRPAYRQIQSALRHLHLWPGERRTFLHRQSPSGRFSVCHWNEFV